MLSDSESSDDGHIVQLTINEHYAQAYKFKKEREDLQKLKDKYGSDAELDDDYDEDSEEDETEDEDGEELTAAMDVAILKTLAKIKNKDPEIYDSSRNIFEEQQTSSSNLRIKNKYSKEKGKPLTIKQHALNSVLNPRSRSTSPAIPVQTYAQGQEALRSETIAVFQTAVDADSETDDLLIPREKTRDEVEQEEEEYRQYLQREVGRDIGELLTIDEGIERIHEENEGVTRVKVESKRTKRTKGIKEKGQSDHEFLMNYILNRGWIDRSARRLPTYAEVTDVKKHNREKGKAKVVIEGDPSRGEGVQVAESDTELVEDDFEELAEDFEASYNFRFEEPGATTITSHPRALTDTVRRQDTSRKETREKRKEKKEAEKEKRREEVKRLKALKMRGIKQKIEKIEKEAGGKGLKEEVLQELEGDLDDDWDPAKHDVHMRKLYDDNDFYGVEDDDKPQWADEIDITDLVPDFENEPSNKKAKKVKKRKDKEDGFGAVDVDRMDANVDEGWDGTEEMRKRMLDQYMDEIYELDFNDMVAGIPTRFKYTTVPPDHFSLTAAEILMATDGELNQYMSIKRIAPYKNKAAWDKDRVAKLKALKETINGRSWGGVPVEELGWNENGANGRDGKPAKKRKGKNERLKAKKLAESQPQEEGMDQHHPPTRVSRHIEDEEEAERPRKKQRKNGKRIE